MAKIINEARFIIEPYGRTLFLVWPANSEMITKYFKKRFKITEEDNGAFEGIFIKYENLPKIDEGFFIFLNGWNNKDRDLGNLVHESFHVCEHMLRSAGMNKNKATSEAYAYLIQSIFNHCLKALKQPKLRKKIKI